MLNLDPIKARCEAATKGPWEWDTTTSAETQTLQTLLSDTASGLVIAPSVGVGFTESVIEIGLDVSAEDRDFIAHSRTDIPALVEEVERLRDENRQIRKLADKRERKDDDEQSKTTN